jgi:hypothetical protein
MKFVEELVSRQATRKCLIIWPKDFFPRTLFGNTRSRCPHKFVYIFIQGVMFSCKTVMKVKHLAKFKKFRSMIPRLLRVHTYRQRERQGNRWTDEKSRQVWRNVTDAFLQQLRRRRKFLSL